VRKSATNNTSSTYVQNTSTKTVNDTPFLEREWVFWASAVLFPPLAILIVWLKKPQYDQKKKIIITAILALWFIISLIIGSGDGESTAAPSGSDVTSTDVSSLTFTITGGDLGEYGEWMTLNEGTEFPDTFIAYKIPVGNYIATNLDPDYPLGIYVYSEATEIVDGWEYQSDCFQIVELQVGEAKSFTVPDGYYIQLIGSENGTAALIEQQ